MSPSRLLTAPNTIVLLMSPSWLLTAPNTIVLRMSPSRLLTAPNVTFMVVTFGMLPFLFLTIQFGPKSRMRTMCSLPPYIPANVVDYIMESPHHPIRGGPMLLTRSPFLTLKFNCLFKN